MSSIDPTVDLPAIEEALVFWARESTGLEVLWENQNAPRLPYPYASLFIPSMDTRGAGDEQRQSFDGSAPAGKELTISYIGYEDLEVVLQVMNKAKESKDPRCSPKNLILRARRALHIESFQVEFRAANIAFIDSEPMLDGSLPMSDTIENRSILTVRFATSSCAAEQTTFFDKAKVSSTMANADPALDLVDFVIGS